MLAGLLIDKYVFTALLLFICGGMLYEFVKLSGKAAYLPIGIVYIIASVSLIYRLGFPGGEFSGLLILAFFIIIWSSDVGAFCVGSLFGQKEGSRKLAPSISPNKSWIGFWGGLAFSVVAAVILHFNLLSAIPLVHCLVLAVLVHCAGVCGDLLESLWKRRCGAKDSGNIIPGHGGLLDRFDSSLAAFPVGGLYLLIFKLL